MVKVRLIKEQKYKNKGWDSFAENLQFKWLKLRHLFSGRKHIDDLQRKIDDARTSRLFAEISKNFPRQSRSPMAVVTFKHSGNAGDLIYALPAIKALGRGGKAKLYLNLDAPINGWSEKEHPLGKSGLTAEMAEFLRPLLECQPYLASVHIYQGEPVDYDLDIFRIIPSVRAGRGHISHWYFWVFPTGINLSLPWLELPGPVAPSHKIVLSRSSRYHNPHLDYAFLRNHGEIDLVGVRSEFQEMRRALPELQHRECANALELAIVIKSARFFIGNQSFPYALAEAIKVPRILEVCPSCPVVIPDGANTGEAFFQSNFEKLVASFKVKTAE